MVVELPRYNLVGGLNNQVASFLVQKFQLDVGHGRGLFKNAQGFDELSRHRVPARSGLEILERTLSLGAPIAVGGDGDFAHGIFFNSSLSHGCSFPVLQQYCKELTRLASGDPSRLYVRKPV